MGKFDGKYIRGVVGKTVYREVQGQQVVQSKPGKPIDQTAETKKAATVFGKASNLSAYIRVALNRSIGFYDGSMISRLTGEVNQIAHLSVIPETQKLDFTSIAFSRLNGFEFNTNSPVRNQLFAQPQVSTANDVLEIDLPEMQIPRDLRFHENGSYCVLGFQVALLDLQNGYYNTQEIEIMEVKYKYEPETVPAKKFSFQSHPGCLCIVTLAIQYYEKTFAGNSVVNNTSFNPSAILKAFLTDGVADPSVTENWKPMGFKTT